VGGGTGVRKAAASEPQSAQVVGMLFGNVFWNLGKSHTLRRATAVFKYSEKCTFQAEAWEER